ncbi:MAG TPA: ATP-binding protein [Thermoanaerobaculia bacterium]|nr:ATP-binding protein [Thermoanaerobaculia bacterium]
MALRGRGESLSSRHRVISVFLAQGIIGALVVCWVTLEAKDTTRATLAALGDGGPALILIFFFHAAALALLRFPLTNLVYVSLVITCFISMFPLLGAVLSCWIAVLAVILTRVVGMMQIGPAKLDMTDPLFQWIRTFAFFGTYGMPVALAALLYEATGGEVPLMKIGGMSTMRMAVCGVALILVNNLVMFPVQLAYGYSVRKSLTLVAVDSSIYLLSVPYAITMTLSYAALGWPAVLALALTGVLANAVARNLAIARVATERQIQRLALLTNIGEAISLQLPINELLMTIYRECRKIIDASFFSIALIDDSTNELSFELDVHEGEILPKERIPIGDGLNSWVVLNGRPLVTGSVRDELALGIVAIDDGVHTESWLGVPMMAGDRVIGVVSVQSPKRNAFREEDVVLMTAIANQTAIAIENSQLYGDLEGLTFALEHRVQERTGELRDANLRLMAADRSKNQFLTNMSHELRTPLNSIIGFSDILLSNVQNELPPKFYGFLRNIRDAGGRLLELINDILELSKIEAGKMQLRVDWFDLRSALMEIEEPIRSRAGETGVSIALAVDTALPRVRLDEGRIRQVVFNLLANALELSSGGSAVTVAARHLSADRSPMAIDSVEIDVTAHGAGIPEAELARIFDEFFRTEGKRRSGRGGTGLGLSLARSLAELHLGSVTVSSPPGYGPSFRLQLPIDYEEAVRMRRMRHTVSRPLGDLSA